MANPFDQQSPIEGVKNIIVVGSGKGGVGKSTVTVNLALALKSKGLAVGLLDADVYGPSLPRLMGSMNQPISASAPGKMDPIIRHGIKLMSMGFLVNESQAVVWRGPMLFKAFEQFFRDVQWGELDYLVVDLPPGTGDVPLTIAQKVPVSGAVVVCTPQNLALADAKKAIDMFYQVRVPLIGIVENMSYLLQPDQSGELKKKVQLFPKGDLDHYLDGKRISKLAEIPFAPEIGLACEVGIPTMLSDPDSVAAVEYLKLADAVIGER